MSDRCLHRWALLSLVLIAAAVGFACGPGVETAFRRTDASFTPRMGRTPEVYLYSIEMPAARMRSVGVVAVSVPARSGIEGVVRAAAAKGREIGCWALVEQALFARMSARAGAGGLHGAAPIPIHRGGLPAFRFTHQRVVIPPPPDRSVVAARFECVFRHDGPTQVRRAAPSATQATHAG